MLKKWTYRDADAPPADLADWAGRLMISDILARLLFRRGLTSVEAMDAYLSPGLRRLMRPEDLPGLETAADLLAAEVAAGKRLCVWGDYDVDGVTGTAILLDFLRRRGLAATSHLPNRMEEGYGVNVAGVERLAKEGVQVLITVDCGVSDLEPVARARELGLTVIVTDHHLPGEALPPAQAICNPKLAPGEGADLPGAGVAFFLAAALNRRLPGSPMDVRELLDLAALGVLADVVPLRGPNRILAKNGMLLINEAKRPGIFALKEVAGVNPAAAMGAGQIVFGLAPRLNAAGRMGRAEAALELLLAPDLETARPLAALLDAENATRRKAEQDILEAAMAQAEEQAGRLGLTLFGPNWHSGVIGIVASRVMESRYRPTLIATLENGRIKGSGRSIPECDLHAALASVSDALLGFGGHRQAAGFSLEPERLDELRERFDAAVRAQLGDASPVPGLSVDDDLPFSLIDASLAREIELMQPFGCGNPEPLFASPPVTVTDLRLFGKDHVNLGLRDPQSGRTLRGKAWRMADRLPRSLTGKSLRAAFTPRLNAYNGLTTIELRIKDFQTLDPRAAGPKA